MLKNLLRTLRALFSPGRQVTPLGLVPAEEIPAPAAQQPTPTAQPTAPAEDKAAEAKAIEVFTPKTEAEVEAFEIGYAEGYHSGFALAWAKTQQQELIKKTRETTRWQRLRQRLWQGIKHGLSIITGVSMARAGLRYIKELQRRNAQAELQRCQLASAAFARLTPSQQAEAAHNDYVKHHGTARSSYYQARGKRDTEPRPIWPIFMAAGKAIFSTLTSGALLVALSILLLPTLGAIYAAIYLGLDLEAYLLLYLQPLIHELDFIKGTMSINTLYREQHWIDLIYLLPPSLVFGFVFGSAYGYQHCRNLITRNDDLHALKHRACIGYITSLGLLVAALFFFTTISVGVIPIMLGCAIWAGALAYDLTGRVAYFIHTPPLKRAKRPAVPSAVPPEPQPVVIPPRPSKQASAELRAQAQARILESTASTQPPTLYRQRCKQAEACRKVADNSKTTLNSKRPAPLSTEPAQRRSCSTCP